MPRHFADFLKAYGHSLGVFLVKQNSPLASTIEHLILVWTTPDAEEWTNRMTWITRK
jgi:hypothetical protein